MGLEDSRDDGRGRGHPRQTTHFLFIWEEGGFVLFIGLSLDASGSEIKVRLRGVYFEIQFYRLRGIRGGQRGAFRRRAVSATTGAQLGFKTNKQDRQ